MARLDLEVLDRNVRILFHLVCFCVAYSDLMSIAVAKFFKDLTNFTQAVPHYKED